MAKGEWSKSMRARMALVMSISGIVPILICHVMVVTLQGVSFTDVLWYVPLLPVLVVMNWFLAGYILRPLLAIRQATKKLAAMDIRQRLELDRTEPTETSELRKSFNKLLNRLEESLNIQCQFVADASHELRTPLTSIQGYTKLLLRRGANIDSNLLAEALQTISDESGRLIRLVSDLLQLARADAGQAIISQQEVVDLRDVLGSVEDTVTVIAPEQIEVQFILAPAPVMVLADGDRLKQVFLNLTNNAIKATQAGGKVTVTLRSSNGQAIIRVIDTGIGIAPADQQRIFDRFYRVERSRTRSRAYGGGSGLGLAIALTIIKAHNGNIELESELNKGSTFTVRLPLAEKKSDRTTKQIAMDGEANSRTGTGSSDSNDALRSTSPPGSGTATVTPGATESAQASPVKPVDGHGSAASPATLSGSTVDPVSGNPPG